VGCLVCFFGESIYTTPDNEMRLLVILIIFFILEVLKCLVGCGAIYGTNIKHLALPGMQPNVGEAERRRRQKEMAGHMRMISYKHDSLLVQTSSIFLNYGSDIQKFISMKIFARFPTVCLTLFWPPAFKGFCLSNPAFINDAGQTIMPYYEIKR